MIRLSSIRIQQFYELCEELEQLPEEARRQRLTQLHGEDADLARLLDLHFTGATSLPELRAGYCFRNYEIIEKLATGGCGELYRAKQNVDGHRRDVALKLIHRDKFTPEFFAQFDREIDHLVRMSRTAAPGIVQILDAGHERLNEKGPEVPYLVMEFVDGISLELFCRARPFKDRVEKFLMVCEAVQAMHDRSILHLDLKPANILVRQDGRPIVLDFGLATCFSPYASVHALGGTLPYMAPEQLNSELGPLGFKSDVYALGVILFQLLTGELPYPIRAGAETTFTRWITSGERRQLRDANSKLPAALEKILDQALALQPRDRLESPAEFARKLRAWRKTETRRMWIKRIATACVGIMALSFVVYGVHTRLSSSNQSTRNAPRSDPPKTSAVENPTRFTTQHVNTLFKDGTTLWIGARSGLHKWEYSSELHPQHVAKNREVLAIMPGEGTALWLGLKEEGLYFWEDISAGLPERIDLDCGTVYALQRFRNDIIICAEKGVFRWSNAMEFRQDHPVKILEGTGRVKTLLFTGSGFWIGAQHGLFQWNVGPESALVASNIGEIHALADAGGVLLVGTSNGLYLGVVDQAKLPRPILAVTGQITLFYKDTNSVWIGGTDGLFKFVLRERLVIPVQGGIGQVLSIAKFNDALIVGTTRQLCWMRNSEIPKQELSHLDVSGRVLEVAGDYLIVGSWDLFVYKRLW